MIEATGITPPYGIVPHLLKSGDLGALALEEIGLCRIKGLSSLPQAKGPVGETRGELS
jgi:hypothetical protein